MLVPLSVNGNVPDLIGEPCHAIIARQFWHQGTLVDPAVLVYLHFGTQWHRLYFDHGTVFWREHDTDPEPFGSEEHEFDYPLVDITEGAGVRDCILERLSMAPTEGGSCVTLVFERGRTLTFDNENDVTHYAS